MPRQKSDPKPLAVLLNHELVERNGDYAHIYARITETEYKDGEVQPSYSYFDSKHLDNFNINCQMDWDRGSFGVYGFGADYRNVYSFDLQDVVRYHKWLTKVQKVIENFPVRPTSFGQYVQLVAQGLKIKQVLVQGDREFTSRTGKTYRHFAVDSLQYHIDGKIEEFRERIAPNVAMKVSG